ncbi:MAG: orotate phosphoribosyltransferase [Clostridiales bacterium]|jgi:orotate phosphoribosyltransferase|nr:orotate phosphoribosyltransferase [Clostridiales bacterium]
MGYKENFIELMLNAGVLTFGDFTTKSGRKTPYFINTGNYQTGEQISALGDYYAECIVASGARFDMLFGPAYKGIPLAVAAASSLHRNYGRNVPYSFNRKEPKDHGEGGSIVGYKPKDGDKAAIIEDVVTAGTAVRETIALFKTIARVDITALYVSVDRMERGSGSLSALRELEQSCGISVHPIVTVREIIHYVSGGGNGNKIIDDRHVKRMEEYLAQYGA